MLGERIRQARLEKGLSQRQLCGEEITRNMLSLIENGSARPSMETLRYIARQLEKPVSWFLDEETVVSPNQPLMEQARALFSQGAYADVATALAAFHLPDSTFEYEYRLLRALAFMGWAEQVLFQGKPVQAADLLEKAKTVAEGTPYFNDAHRRQWLLLMGKTGQAAPGELVARLPSGDAEPILRAKAALASGDIKTAVAYLETVQERGSLWQLLRGRAAMLLMDHAGAVEYFLAAEAVYPKECCKALEQCYQQLEDYKKAYEYACKLREL